MEKTTSGQTAECPDENRFDIGMMGKMRSRLGRTSEPFLSELPAISRLSRRT